MAYFAGTGKAQGMEQLKPELARLKGRVKAVKQWMYIVDSASASPQNQKKSRPPGFCIEGIEWEKYSDKSFFVHINKRGLPDSVIDFNNEGMKLNVYSYEYDIYKSVIRENIESTSSLGKLAANHQYFYQYNSSGDITAKISIFNNILRNYEKNSYSINLKNGAKILTIRSCNNQQQPEYTHMYTYDNNGSTLQVKKYMPDSLVYEKNLAYDSRQRLILENEYIQLNGKTQNQQTTYSYDTGILPVKITGEDGIRLYAYDSLGNIVSYKRFNKQGNLLLDFSFAYEYDENNNWLKRHWLDKLNVARRFCTERKIEYYKLRELEEPGSRHSHLF